MKMQETVYRFEGLEMSVFSNDQNFTLVQEFNSESPMGESFSGHWVLRDWDGQIVDYDLFLDEVIKRNDIEVIWSEK